MKSGTGQRDVDGADLIVLSDLHLGEGLLADEPRYVPTEDFFHDLQFAHFLKALARDYEDDPSRLKLVLNGDTFDFLTITSVPKGDEAKRRGFTVSAPEKKFGLNPTAKKSVYKLDVMVSGHGRFFRALARFVKEGFGVEIVRGNHDLELHFKEVRERLIDHLASFETNTDRSIFENGIHFHPWFYLEPGRIFIEHGNQYDAANSIRYPYHPILPVQRRSAEKEDFLDYPLGSIFVKFFYNRVRQLDPYSPRLVSFDHYLSFIKRYNLFDVWRVYKDHYPHFLRALGTTTTIGSSGATDHEDARQAAVLDQLSRQDKGSDLHKKLNALKISPVTASKANVVKEMVSAFVRRGLRFGILAFIAIFAWFGILQLIDLVPGVTANAFLMALFAVVTLGGAITVWIQLDRKLRRHQGLSDVSNLSERAARIADVTGVKVVCMGHTHMVDYHRINQGSAVYANSGTWTSIDNPWSRFMRDARRLTFLRVIGEDVELLRWNDDADRFDHVPLFQVGESPQMDQLPSVTALDVTVSDDISLPPLPAYSVDEEEYSDEEPH
jgi:UDP-2,3-diacylglucosamine pyrophosphatase LpxH